MVSLVQVSQYTVISAWNSMTTPDDWDKTEVLAKFFSSVFTKEPEREIPNLQPKETKFRCAEHQIEEKEYPGLCLPFWVCIFLEFLWILFHVSSYIPFYS
jgi:hypothetical protein